MPTSGLCVCTVPAGRGIAFGLDNARPKRRQLRQGGPAPTANHRPPRCHRLPLMPFRPARASYRVSTTAPNHKPVDQQPECDWVNSSSGFWRQPSKAASIRTRHAVGNRSILYVFFPIYDLLTSWELSKTASSKYQWGRAGADVNGIAGLAVRFVFRRASVVRDITKARRSSAIG